MSIEFTNLQLGTGPFETPVGQLIPHVDEMEVGDIRYVEVDSVLIDRTSAHGTWIYRHAKVMSDEDVIEFCMDAYEDGEDQPELARIIRATEGFVIDQSHEEKHEWITLEDKYNREDVEYLEHSPEKFIPVVFRAHNTVELELIKENLAIGSNIVLDGTDLDEILETVDDLIIEANGIDIDSNPDADENGSADDLEQS